jgi:hypothetical protein
MFELLKYPSLLIMSREKSFEAMGRLIGKTGKTISRWLATRFAYYDAIMNIVTALYFDAKELYLIFDETLLRKLYAESIEGYGFFYETKSYRRIKAFKMLVAMLSDGKKALPFLSTFLFSKELYPDKYVSKYEYIQNIIMLILKKFPNVKLTVVVDGGFCTKNLLQWCNDKNIRLETRIRCNAKVKYKGVEYPLSAIKKLKPKGHQMARTVHVFWDGIPIFITAQRRLDKNNNETIVYQASTFYAKPSEHVKIYKFRWAIEESFRTEKQKLGLESCTARTLDAQQNHVAAVLFAYCLAQLDRKKQKLKSPDQAIRAAERKNGTSWPSFINRLDHLIGALYV